MEEVNVPDSLTMANQIALYSTKKTKVVNFGVSSFNSSLEMIKYFDLLKQVKKNERPHFAIFYDGNNDAYLSLLYGPGSMQGDIKSKMALLIEGRYGTLASYSIIKYISNFLSCFEPIENYFNSMIFSRAVPDFSDEVVRKGVSVYLDNIKMINSVGKEFNVQCIFILQPLLVTKKNLSPLEQTVIRKFSPELISAMQQFYSYVLQSKPANFYDLSGLFDNDNRTDFIDLCHTAGPYSSVDVGMAIGKIISSYFDNQKDLRFSPPVEMP